MRYLYSLMLLLITPLLLVRLGWKGRRLPAYRKRIAERFGLQPIAKADIWIHAVSLGEVIAVTPLIEAFIQKNQQVFVTTMTPTGSAQLQKHFGERLSHQYLPYDLPWIMKAFYHQIKPKFGLIMETELWPNMIHYAALAKIPLFLANARLSDRSFRQYQKVVFFFQPLLRQFSKIFTQSEEDRQRFIGLGAPESSVTTLGNLKFDGQMKTIDNQKFHNLKVIWGEKRSILIAASTHDDEERQILAGFKKLQQAIPDMLLIIAPRHPERFQDVYKLSIETGFNTGLRSQQSSLSAENTVVILDSLGELLHFYAISNYAFVGGSLVPIGGHNVLEPIAAKIPVLCGKHMQNSKSICRDLKAAKAIMMVENMEEFVNSIITLHHDIALKKQYIENATQVLEANQGVLARYLAMLPVN